MARKKGWEISKILLKNDLKKEDCFWCLILAWFWKKMAYQMYLKKFLLEGEFIKKGAVKWSQKFPRFYKRNDPKKRWFLQKGDFVQLWVQKVCGGGYTMFIVG